MAKTVTFDVNVDTGNSVKTLATMKAELQSINEELEQVEVGSQAFKELSTQAATANGKIKDIEKSFEGLDSTQRTEAFAKGFEGIAGAVAVTAGTMALFGVESEKIGKIEQQVQGAIAIAIGARSLAEGVLAAKTIQRTVAEKGAAAATKAMAIAQGIFNAVMNMNPIFLLVTVLAAVTAGIYLFTQAMGDNTEEVEANNKALAARAQLLEDSANFSVRIGAALGKSAQEQKEAQIAATKATQNRLQSELGLTEELEDRNKIYEELIKVGDDLIIQGLELGKIKQDEIDKTTKAAADEKKRKDDEFKKNREESTRKRDEAKKLAQDIADDAALIGLNEEEKAIELETRKYEERLAVLNKFKLDSTELERLHQDEISKIQTEAQDKRDKEADEKKKVTDAAALEKEKQVAQLRLNIRDAVSVSQDQQRALEITKLGEYYDTLITEATANGIETANLELAKNTAIGLKNDEFRQSDTDKQKAYREQVAALTIGAATNLISTLTSLNEAFAGTSEEEQKKAFKRNQSLQIAQTIIDTFSSATGAFNSLVGIPVVGPALGGIAAAAAVAAGLANVRKIKDTKFEGVSADGGSVPSGTQGGGGTPTSGFTPIGQLAEGSITTPQFGNNKTTPTRSYVLSGDVATGLEADKRLNQRRTL